MRIAIIGSAPSSIRLAPYGDPDWQIYGCSPGAYHVVSRVTAWFELHRWEPPTVGRPDKQVPWFSPEYVQWMAKQPLVWVSDPAALSDLPSGKLLAWEELCERYGHYWFTSSIAWMMATAIDAIRADRTTREGETQDAIGFWGVDMSATEEYSQQRMGCQFFAQLAWSMGIQVIVPPESDLLVPAPLYGVSETWHRSIKLRARRSELEQRLAANLAAKERTLHEELFLRGALDDMTYQQQTWIHEGEAKGPDLAALLGIHGDSS